MTKANINNVKRVLNTIVEYLVLNTISQHPIDQLHSIHRPDNMMLHNLTSSATEVPTFHSSTTKLV